MTAYQIEENEDNEMDLRSPISSAEKGHMSVQQTEKGPFHDTAARASAPEC